MAFSFVAFSFVFFPFQIFPLSILSSQELLPHQFFDLSLFFIPGFFHLIPFIFHLSSFPFSFPFYLSLLPNLSILSFLSSIFPLFHPFLSSSLTYLCLPLSVIHIHAILNACNSKGIFNSIDYRLHTRREHRSKNVDKQKHEKTRKRQENNNYMLTTLFQHDNQLININ